MEAAAAHRRSVCSSDNILGNILPTELNLGTAGKTDELLPRLTTRSSWLVGEEL